MSGAELICISQRRATKADVGNIKNWKKQEFQNHTEDSGLGRKIVLKAMGRQMGAEARHEENGSCYESAADLPWELMQITLDLDVQYLWFTCPWFQQKSDT